MKKLSKDALIVAPRQELIDTIMSLQASVDEMSFQIDWFKRQVLEQNLNVLFLPMTFRLH
jgi:hypothetical protein